MRPTKPQIDIQGKLKPVQSVIKTVTQQVWLLFNLSKENKNQCIISKEENIFMN